MRLTRLERATYGFEVRCSIQLSYKRVVFNQRASTHKDVFECGVPSGVRTRQPDPQSGTLPLSYRHRVTDENNLIKKRRLVSR